MPSGQTAEPRQGLFPELLIKLQNATAGKGALALDDAIVAVRTKGGRQQTGHAPAAELSSNTSSASLVPVEIIRTL